MNELTIGSLFSGIGGLELGLEWAGLGPVRWQVELERTSRAVLAHHWPDADRYADVRSVGGANLAPVDLICGGFPCQDVSSAGKGAGLAGERSGLWREFARVVDEMRPRWVVVENVTSGASRWVDAVVCGLEELGYACLPVPLSAADVGAPHARARVFIVARRLADAGSWGRREGQRDEHEGQPDTARGAAADPLRPRREGHRPESHEGWPGPVEDPWRPPVGELVPLVHGVSGGMAGRVRRASIRSLGLSVVPQCAEVVGWVVRELEGMTP